MISIVFGKPGAGKSTIASFFVQRNKKKKDKYYKKIGKSWLYKKLSDSEHKFFNTRLLNLLYPKHFFDVIYSTDETIQDTVYIEYEHIGLWKPTWNSCLIFEEVGVGFDNRSYKTLPKHAKRFFALHRHSGCDIVAISQTTDMDKSLRTRAEILFIASKVGQFTLVRKILFSIDVDEQTHQIVEGYFKITPLRYIWELLTCKLPKHRKRKELFIRSFFIYRPFYYKYFDSFVDDYEYTMIAPDVILELEKEEQKKEQKKEQENLVTEI